MNKKVKKVLTIALLVLFVSGSIMSYFQFIYKPAPVVNDHTSDAPQAERSDAPHEYEDESNVAVFSSNVNFFVDSEADDVNAAISGKTLTNNGLILQVDAGTALDSLGIGDVFYLEGDPSTPLGETYIGKIISESKDEDTTTYVIADPMIDEVFDVLNIDCHGELTADNITQIETVEGVTVTTVNNIESHFTNSAVNNNGYYVTNLANTSAARLGAPSVNLDEDSLLIEYKLDLLEAFGLNKGSKKSSDFQEKHTNQEALSVKVYKTTTGMCYHRENCACVGRSKYEFTLFEAVQEGYEPCFLCNPPLLEEKFLEFKPTLSITGKVGLEDMTCDVVFDWDIYSGNGIENFSINTSGELIGEVEAKANMALEFGGKKTTISLPLNSVKFQALSEKVFPLAFIGYNLGTVVTAFNNDELRTNTFTVPLTIGAMVYVDTSGKISVGATANFSCSKNFSYTNTVVHNGEWIFDSDLDAGDPKTTLGAEVELEGDVDLHLGASIMIYVFNLNPVELGLVKAGAEAEGTLKASWSSDKVVKDDAISSSYYLRAYLKFMDLKVKLKASGKLGAWKANADLSKSFLAKDITLVEFGAKNPTRSNSSMSYSAVTAQDESNIYYKDTNGNLVKEANGVKTTLWTESFFTICGIDESYIYILRNNPETSGTHDIYRVSVVDGTGKKIAEEIANCLTTDERYIYYVSNFDPTSIMRLDRQSLQEEIFYSSDYDIRFMASQDDGFYVVAEENDIFSWLLGTAYHYTLINKSGQTVIDYGTTTNVLSMHLIDINGYYEAAKMTSSGYLRSTAEQVYWLSADKQSYAEAVGISGWKPDNAGIFTTLKNDESAEAPYHIALYQANDGQKVTITEVYSDQAFFTLCRSSSGNWYYFDQTEDSLILYTMKHDFTNKQIVKTFSLDEIPYNLSECGMTIMDNRIYFYTIPDNSTSHVLYRYDIT